MSQEERSENSDGLARKLFGMNSGQTRTPDEIRDAVYLSVGDVPVKQSRFWLLLVLSGGIAAAGVIADSTATVIGAMIVAPLATPIQGVGVSISYGEVRPMLASISILAAAAGAVIGIGLLFAWALPDVTPLTDNSQVTGRVSPTIVDLVAATVTGLAGSIAIARRDIGDILPGVAIAISLVPPLAVVGVTAEAGDWDGALGALLLFLTNTLAMIVVGVLIFSGLQLVRGGRPKPAIGSAFTTVLVMTTIVVMALGVTTYRTVQQANKIADATEIGKSWAEKNGERLIEVRYQGDELVFIVEGMSDGSEDNQLPKLLKGQLPDGTPVVVNRIPGERIVLPDIGE